MPKAIKITPSSIEHFDDWETDPDYVNNEIAAYALNGLTGFSNKYKLTFCCLDVFTDDEKYHTILLIFRIVNTIII